MWKSSKQGGTPLAMSRVGDYLPAPERWNYWQVMYDEVIRWRRAAQVPVLENRRWGRERKKKNEMTQQRPEMQNRTGANEKPKCTRVVQGLRKWTSASDRSELNFCLCHSPPTWPLASHLTSLCLFPLLWNENHHMESNNAFGLPDM